MTRLGSTTLALIFGLWAMTLLVSPAACAAEAQDGGHSPQQHHEHHGKSLSDGRGAGEEVAAPPPVSRSPPEARAREGADGPPLEEDSSRARPPAPTETHFSKHRQEAAQHALAGIAFMALAFGAAVFLTAEYLRKEDRRVGAPGADIPAGSPIRRRKGYEPV